jgi:hypothetical protein
VEHTLTLAEDGSFTVHEGGTHDPWFKDKYLGFTAMQVWLLTVIVSTWVGGEPSGEFMALAEAINDILREQEGGTAARIAKRRAAEEGPIAET